MTKRLGAEFLGTFWLVLGGCGSAGLAATFPEVGIGLVGVSLAFGLTVVTMAYAVGHIAVANRANNLDSRSISAGAQSFFVDAT